MRVSLKQLGRDAISKYKDSVTPLGATQGQILSEPPTDATRRWWCLYGN